MPLVYDREGAAIRMIRKSEDLPEHIGLIRADSDLPVYIFEDKKGTSRI
jgi:hypothetical protein